MSQSAGARAKSNGAALESLLAIHHASAHTQEIASVRKVEPPVRRIRSLGGGQFVAVYGAKSGADFRGIMRGGLALVIESKSSAGESLARSEFTQAERDDLDDCADLGGRAIVVWHRSDTGQTYAIPWEAMPWRKSGRGESVRVEDVQQWRVTAIPYLARFIPPAVAG